ncbi:DUF6049 family protein [Nocardioides zeae]|uniref:DUF6049 family protein n=1 Tax=Nocardioides imazamoxiresistens TaxID=3231893 RepID=A0ABU3PUQ4_9ACTN|nr:DUF6049 family protein [Nocardioides zeae]MDT9592957.1 DUF6049 family protein [Nocardioides zeae]
MLEPATGGCLARRSARAALLPLVVLLAFLLGLPAVAATASAATTGVRTPVGANAAQEPATDPLVVTIDRVTPDTLVLSPDAVVSVSGTVTNATDETWTDVRVYPLTSSSPMTSGQELDDAVAEDADTFIGERLTDEGLFDDAITRLPSGETRRFSLSVPADALEISGAPGVYWLGVHALGATEEGRTGNAAGKARTFLPVVAEGATTQPVPTTVVVPLREPVAYTSDGSVDDTEKWEALLGEGGRLRELADLALGGSASSVTWLLDPALLDVARRLAAGNPARDLGAVEEPEETDEPEAADEPTTAAGEDTDLPSPPEDDPLATAAAEWLADVLAALGEADVLALPYGDVDVAGAAQRGPTSYAWARTLTAQALERYALPATPAVAPPADGVTAEALDMVEDGTTLLLPDDRLPDGALPVGEVLGDLGELRVVATDSATATGGPAPGPRTSGLQVRQRIVAETVVDDLVATSSEARVVVLPASWDPDGGGLPVDGASGSVLDAEPLSSLRATPAEVTTEDVVVADPPETTVPGATFRAVGDLLASGQVLDRVLPDTDRVSSGIAREALPQLGYAHRDDDGRSADVADAAADVVRGLLARITVEAPASVTLASESGRFSVRVVNGLEQPVEIELQGESRDGAIIAPSEPLTLPPGGSTTVLLEAELRTLGVFDVDVLVTDTTGVPLGATAALPIRSAAVSDVIWIVIGVAFVVLVAASSLWIRRRRAGADDGPEPETREASA